MRTPLRIIPESGARFEKALSPKAQYLGLRPEISTASGNDIRGLEPGKSSWHQGPRASERSAPERQRWLHAEPSFPTSGSSTFQRESLVNGCNANLRKPTESSPAVLQYRRVTAVSTTRPGEGSARFPIPS
ncbi:hypothetical protein AAFF_G00171060 [Aldrovandia affinis]|uniref:Uncharacterized protein n=1 Tax=Aldrovandia affinis TaxID=143900 RepID=A0AAD7RLB6_9TELE|nr:hypothetical protein AAFF_G00171060 [Aldrovandia affinis]